MSETTWAEYETMFLEQTLGLFVWWKRELLELLPGALRARWRPQEDGQEVVLEAAFFESSSPAGTPDSLEAGHIDRQRPVHLVIPSARIYITERRFPQAVASGLAHAIALQLGSLSPLPQDEVAFDHRIVERDREAQALRVEVALVRKSDVETGLSWAAASGIDLASIGSATSGEWTPQFWQAPTPKELLTRVRRNLGLGVLILCLIAVFSLALENRSTRAMSAWNEQLRRMSQGAQGQDQIGQQILALENLTRELAVSIDVADMVSGLSVITQALDGAEENISFVRIRSGSAGLELDVEEVHHGKLKTVIDGLDGFTHVSSHQVGMINGTPVSRVLVQRGARDAE